MSDDLRNALKNCWANHQIFWTKKYGFGGWWYCTIISRRFFTIKNEGFYFEGYIDKNKSLIGEIIGDKKFILRHINK